MAATVVAWIVLGEEFGLANIALAAVVVLFALRVVRGATSRATSTGA